MAGNARKNARNRPKPSIDADEVHHPINTDNKINLKLRREKFTILRSSRFRFVIGFFAIFVFAFSTYLIYFHFTNSVDHGSQKPRVITPFPAPKLMDLPQVYSAIVLLIIDFI